ncbi:MAG TPA: imidazole glycerol phosphate synthase subunit HisH [Ohtaekwangia sp.]|nr:imidazole glycerol phosphate synthase subunit HisH [Ohtaekwangia sp.]
MIAIVDYEAGNIGSIKNMLHKLGAAAEITGDPERIRLASKIILPGVGSFDYGVTRLRESGVIDVLNERKLAGTPVLGICLGAQLMCHRSEEGKLPGLSWINGEVVRFPQMVGNTRYSVPHIGWDDVMPVKPSRLFGDMPGLARFYFVHSYYISCATAEDILAKNTYGVPFDAAFEKENIAGVQFHPEKSHKFGSILLKNFVDKF